MNEHPNTVTYWVTEGNVEVKCKNAFPEMVIHCWRHGKEKDKMPLCVFLEMFDGILQGLFVLIMYSLS